MTMFQSINVPQAGKLLVHDFMLLHDSGAFAGHAKSELIEGDIWFMNAVWTAHAKAQFRLSRAVAEGLEKAGLDLEVFSNLSIDLSPDSMPEPDIVVAEDHDAGPMPLAKVKVVIEISDSTLDIDLGRKAALYAKAGIAEYWVADLEGRRIVQLCALYGGSYTTEKEIQFGEQVVSQTLAGVIVETAGLR